MSHLTYQQSVRPVTRGGEGGRCVCSGLASRFPRWNGAWLCWFIGLLACGAERACVALLDVDAFEPVGSQQPFE